MCQVLGSVSEEISSKMSVAELQSCEHNGMVSGQICDIVIGQSESSRKMCTVCTACTVKNVQIATNLAKSRQTRCIFADTKGGPSSKRGGGHALEVIQHYEESLHGKTGKQILSESTENISFVSSSSSSEKTLTQQESLEKHRRKIIYPV